jgi:uncharacterized damage-inducible protein DinB
VRVDSLPEPVFPRDVSDERELFLTWLAWLRGAVIRKADGVTDEQAHWTPDGRLTSIIGLVNHLTHVEWRWIDGTMLGSIVNRSESEFAPRRHVTIEAVLCDYRSRAAKTDSYVRAHDLDERGIGDEDVTLRWVLLHLINETARHAGHADATREMLDGTVGE